MQRDGVPAEALSGPRCPDDGKVRYISRKAAKKAASQIESQHRGRSGRKLRPYLCGDFWHLTSQATAKVTHYREQDRGAAA